mgnify:CR=1 FL=1
MKSLLLLFLLLLSGTISWAQEAKTSILYKTILEKDSLLFKVAFNHCDLQ